MSEHFGNDALRQETNAGKADMHILHSLPAALIRRGNIDPVHKIMQHSKTIFLTSHHYKDIEQLCDQVYSIEDCQLLPITEEIAARYREME